MPICPQCHRDIQAGWKFCRFCGQALPLQSPVADDAVDGLLSPGLLARRVGPGDMQGLLAKTLVVEEGQAALLLIGGRHDETLGPGKHSKGNTLGSRARNTTVVLVKSADVSLDITVGNLLTLDPLSLTLDIGLSVKVEKPILLWQNLAGDADCYSMQHLAAALYPLVEAGCRQFVGPRSIRELDSRQDVRQVLQLALASHLDQPAGPL